MDLLEYSKLILERVSFSPELFQKELQESIDVLKPQEIISLRTWCISEFGKKYPDVMVNAFQIIPNRQLNVLDQNNKGHESYRY